MFTKFFSKNLWVFLTAAVAGTGCVASYYAVDYFTYWSDEQLEKQFSKMLDLYSSYLELFASKKIVAKANLDSTQSQSSSKSAENIILVEKDLSDSAKEIWKLYNEIFVPGNYHKLPAGIKAFGLLRILTMKRSKIFSTFLKNNSSTNDGVKIFEEKDLHILDNKILQQLDVIYDNFHKVPESVRKFFSFFLNVFPNSGIEFLDKDDFVPFPEMSRNSLDNRNLFKENLLKTLSKARKIAREIKEVNSLKNSIED